MFEKDSPQDLLLRGFSREYILDKTGTDVGYHGNAMKKELKGIDRVAYKVEFVKSNYTNDEIATVLNEYAAGIDAATVLDRLGLAGVNIIKLNVLFKGLGLSDEFKEADKKHRKGIMKQGMLDKYGVDNPFKLESFQDVARETRKEKYGAVDAEANNSTIDYESVRSRSKQLLAGTFHKWTTKSFIDACNYIHGGRYSYDKTEYVRRDKKVIITCPVHGDFEQTSGNHLYGYGCPACAGVNKLTPEIFISKAKNIHGDKYDYSLIIGDISSHHKVAIICPEHGVFEQTPTGHLSGKGCSKCAAQKREETNLKRYGVKNVMSLPETLDKIKTSTQNKYGVDYAMQDKYLAQKQQGVISDKYGVKSFLGTKACRNQLVRRCMERYGVSHPMQSKEVVSKNLQTKRKNGTFNTSSIEERIKALGTFESQYNKDARYPYLCDFYDRDRDLFIEVNASWIHGYHWYDVENDVDTCKKWKAKTRDSKYYANALDVFTKRDVEKRECARKNKLNYVTLWDSDGMDADLWFAMGMPLGKDWEREYSWLPYHYIPEEVDVSNMRLSWRSLSAIVKDAQRKVFYKRELELWNANPLRKGKWGTVQAFLYANRYKYLNKLPHELTDRMLLRAFRISGLHMGYTSFNSSLMRQVIEKYNVKSVYDPCAGWGERMMTCGKLGVSYEGCDINSELFEGYKKLYELIDGFKPVLHNNDSANQLVTGEVDAVITCPPYKGIEVYSENGAENLSDEDFVAWWSDVVKNCSYSNAKVFAVQTNQACRSVFEDALVAQGWQLKDELVFDNNQKSHFHRVSGMTKREYESMLVFVR
ncbi:MAG: hypothetical protein KH433_02445 [Campylobacter concisus]|nr:hypothetical protein [Campylobacter concisus]